MASVPLTDFRDIAHDAIGSVGQSTQVLSIERASEPEFQQQWQALANVAVEPNPFFEPWFLLPSLKHLGNAQGEPLFAVYEGDQLVGLMPIAARNQYYQYPVPHIAGWMHNNMFCGAPLVAVGHERDFWRALLGHHDAKPAVALFFHLPALPAHGPLAQALFDVVQCEGRQSAIVHSHERAFLSSDATSQDYFNASLSTKKRKELRRQQRRLGELGELSFHRELGEDNTDQWAREFLELERAGWKGEQGSALAEDDATQALFLQSLRGAAKAGRLERLALRLDGKPIAMLANFLTPPGAFSFKTAFDEDYARFSPGVLLQQENLALLDREEINWCDSCAAAGHPMIERIWREKRRMISVSIAIGGTLRRNLFATYLRAETHQPFGPKDVQESAQ